MGGIVMTELQSRRDARGFTLMEMLVVLGILAMLLALVVPRILGTQKKADVSTAQSQIKLLQKCLQGYFLDMKEFPTTDQGLKALIEKPSDLSDEAAKRWAGPYTDDGTLPKDPWGHEYQYEYPPTHGAADSTQNADDTKKTSSANPDIWSFGPDGEDGTDDDICNWSQSQGKDQGTNQDQGSSQSSRSERSSTPSAGK
jgi:general secretion pathway protein G